MMPDVTPLHPHGIIALQEINEQMMMDNVVSGGTRQAYNISNTLAFFRWCIEHKPGWLTPYAQNKQGACFFLRLSQEAWVKGEKIMLEMDLLN